MKNHQNFVNQSADQANEHLSKITQHSEHFGFQFERLLNINGVLSTLSFLIFGFAVVDFLWGNKENQSKRLFIYIVYLMFMVLLLLFNPAS